MDSSHFALWMSSNSFPAAAIMRDSAQRQHSQLSAVVSLGNNDNTALLRHLVHQEEILEMVRLKEQVAVFNGGSRMSAPASFAAHDGVALALLGQQLQHKQRMQDLRSSYHGMVGLQGINSLPTAPSIIRTSPTLAQMVVACTMNGTIGIKAKNEVERFQQMSSTGMSLLQQQHPSSVAATQLLQHTIQDAMDLNLPLPVVRKRRGRTGTFPQKLHQILDDLERQGRSDVACFMNHGRAFVIYKPIEFAEEIMPKYFRMSHFSSLQRQLNLYDFQRITEGPDKGGYYHELFAKGQLSRSFLMKRTKMKGVANLAAANTRIQGRF